MKKFTEFTNQIFGSLTCGSVTCPSTQISNHWITNTYCEICFLHDLRMNLKQTNEFLILCLRLIEIQSDEKIKSWKLDRSTCNFQPLIILITDYMLSQEKSHIHCCFPSDFVYFIIQTHLNFNEVCLKSVNLLLRTENKRRKLDGGSNNPLMPFFHSLHPLAFFLNFDSQVSNSQPTPMLFPFAKLCTLRCEHGKANVNDDSRHGKIPRSNDWRKKIVQENWWVRVWWCQDNDDENRPSRQGKRAAEKEKTLFSTFIYII